MHIDKPGYQPNFQARFVLNNDLKDFTKEQVENGNEDELKLALRNLSKIKSNVALELTRLHDNPLSVLPDIRITNLYNGLALDFKEPDAKAIAKLSDCTTYEYKNLFSKPTPLTAKEVKTAVNSIADKYYINSVPDYTLGHQVDKKA